MVHRAWAKPPWRISSPPSWALVFVRPQDLYWNVQGDLAAIFSTNLNPGDVLFIDEIHRLHPIVEEALYPAMEDYQLDLVVGQGPSARTLKLDLPRFTPHRCHNPRRTLDVAVA